MKSVLLSPPYLSFLLTCFFLTLPHTHTHTGQTSATPCLDYMGEQLVSASSNGVVVIHNCFERTVRKIFGIHGVACYIHMYIIVQVFFTCIIHTSIDKLLGIYEIRCYHVQVVKKLFIRLVCETLYNRFIDTGNMQFVLPHCITLTEGPSIDELLEYKGQEQGAERGCGLLGYTAGEQTTVARR